jgi:ATP-dependent DNA ligase
MFPTLHGEATNGKTKVWNIEVLTQPNNTAVIRTTHGYLDGKMQTTDKTITTGKNIGRSNETTPLQQAISEARSAWVKRTENGYAPSAAAVAEAEDAEEDEDEEPVSRSKGIDAAAPSPMLAHDYHKRGRSAVFPCFTQRKLDGVRCVAMPGRGLFSRQRKPFPHLEHILEEISTLDPTIPLDGELYSTTLHFQEIVSLVKRVTQKPGDAEKMRQIQFHVYDMITPQPYAARHDALNRLFQTRRFRHLKLVETRACRSEEEMKEQHAQFVAEGYEGIMLRTPNGAYKGSRSTDLLKYKEFFDDEFEITGYKEGEGLEEGCVIWIAKIPSGAEFSCRPRGSREERAELYQAGDAYIGKQLTVRYQELTPDGIPRFPVGIAIRDYE